MDPHPCPPSLVALLEPCVASPAAGAFPAAPSPSPAFPRRSPLETFRFALFVVYRFWLDYGLTPTHFATAFAISPGLAPYTTSHVAEFPLVCQPNLRRPGGILAQLRDVLVLTSRKNAAGIDRINAQRHQEASLPRAVCRDTSVSRLPKSLVMIGPSASAAEARRAGTWSRESLIGLLI